ncbi:hypothetical protein LCGC14_2247030 [marine sediment metagenome]|uniref:Uncharacterized protein n=1 Tax=marine sediment metagenome TaxID=412755 RepID=A0A0F9D3H5_9ZZZZ
MNCPTVTNLMEATDALLKFIEENDIQDEMADDGDGYTDTWRSGEFSELIEHAQARLNELKEDIS